VQGAAHPAVRRIRFCLHQTVRVRPRRDGVARDDPHSVSQH